MRRLALRMNTAGLCLALLAAWGCGRRGVETQRREEPPSASSVGGMEMGGSVIRVADPAGQWRFEARSEQVEAEDLGGPYRLQPADCRYQEKDRPPVLMQAATAKVDRVVQRVVLEGTVRISYGGWMLEAERAEYDLKQGKVVATGQAKLSYGGDQQGRPQSSGSDKGEQ